jgi:glyoxylase-like metal-dependent hydrolase (beta-lactamase superfamily II)
MTQAASPPPLPLEDNHLDILGKAQRGKGWSTEQLASESGVDPAALARIQNGEVLPEEMGKLAVVLGLGARALQASAEKSWRPAPVQIPHLETFTTPFTDMMVNAYLAWDSETGEAVVFDSGADASGILEFAAANQLKIVLILITHTHGDHIFDLDRLMEKTGAPAWVGDREPALDGTERFSAGKVFRVGKLSISTRLTWGHAEGGITYVVDGLDEPVAVVGDALFAGSMGGGKVSYSDALQTTRSEILSLPEETIVASGHGPLTTVGEEKSNNPFFTS